MPQSGAAAIEPGGLPRRESNRRQWFAWLTNDAEDQTRSRWPEICALALYAALVALAIPYHEPFVDEAQAWQLARTLTLGSLFHTFMHYEGAPILWHFLLWLMIRAHVGYAGLHWICGVIATAASAVLIFKSPFPRYLKLTLPFTYFLFFQYAIVARNYVLVPLMLFGVAACWRKRPLAVTVLLGLMANTALHVAVISGGLAIVYAIEQMRSQGTNDTERRRKLLLCALLLLAFYAFAIWTAWPPHDVAIMRIRGESRPFLVSAIQSLAWGVCQPMILSVPFWGIFAFWLAGRRKLLYLLPVLFFGAFCGAVNFNWWHVGLLVPLIACIMWINWTGPGTAIGTGPFEFEKAGRLALAFMIATQILWSGYAFYYDHYHPYSPDLAAAQFLKPYVQQGAGIAVSYASNDKTFRAGAFPVIGILPYFDRNIFVNTPYPFWWWSRQDPTAARYEAAIEAHVPIALVAVVTQHPVPQPDLNYPAFATLERLGYRHVNTTCGTMPQGLKPGITVCDVIYQYSGSSGQPGK